MVRKAVLRETLNPNWLQWRHAEEACFPVLIICFPTLCVWLIARFFPRERTHVAVCEEEEDDDGDDDEKIMMTCD
jgi:hypothetical protein